MYYIEEDDKPSWIEKKFNVIKQEGNKIIIPLEDKEGNKEKIKEIKIAKGKDDTYG